MSVALLMVYALCAEPAVVEAWRPLLPTPVRLDAVAAAQFHEARWRRPLWDALADDPLLAPTLAETGALACAADAGRLAPTLERLGQRSGLGVNRSLRRDLLAKMAARLGDRPLSAGLAAVRRAGGGVLAPAGDPAVDDVPPALGRAMGLLLLAVEGGLEWRARAFEEAPAGGLARSLDDLRRMALPGGLPAGPESFQHQRRLDRLMAGFDVKALAAAADDLALVFDAVRADMKPVPGWTTRRWTTPLGEVVLAGDGADAHGGEPPLLLIDLGGDDRYQGGARATDDRHPFSVVIDVAGNDTYAADSGLGAAVGGVAMQIDLAGNDTYTARSLAQGCGIGGVGLLYDVAGDDRYVGEVHCQGAGALGLGLLIDADGSDEYRATSRAQGYGYALGAGLLLDAGGSANSFAASGGPDEVDGACLAQGCGFGRRSDGTDGHSLAGGLGWLVSGSGDDRFVAGRLAQGVGYGFGIGLLTDLGGADRHECAAQGQGFGQQAGMGIAWDGDGDDFWSVAETGGLGGAIDFGLGWLIDRAGRDTYVLRGVGLGGATANGLAFCWDGGGDDEYRADGGPALGRGQTVPTAALLATSLRRAWPTLGFLLDSGGVDTYTGALKRP
ncbi:MAG: hypothetical protein HZB16_04005 [Armatimonadetes bacterium]|nr:hypothetical protein [Armatimonadota bacterium]